jgi:transposase-like protein
MAKRRSFTPKFKTKAVSLLQSTGSATEAAKKLHITPAMLYKWAQQASPESKPTSIKDTLVFLKHAEREIIKEVRTGRSLKASDLYTLLALQSLQGK